MVSHMAAPKQNMSKTWAKHEKHMSNLPSDCTAPVPISPSLMDVAKKDWSIHVKSAYLYLKLKGNAQTYNPIDQLSKTQSERYGFGDPKVFIWFGSIQMRMIWWIAWDFPKRWRFTWSKVDHSIFIIHCLIIEREDLMIAIATDDMVVWWSLVIWIRCQKWDQITLGIPKYNVYL